MSEEMIQTLRASGWLQQRPWRDAPVLLTNDEYAFRALLDCLVRRPAPWAREHGCHTHPGKLCPQIARVAEGLVAADAIPDEDFCAIVRFTGDRDYPLVVTCSFNEHPTCFVIFVPSAMAPKACGECKGCMAS